LCKQEFCVQHGKQTLTNSNKSLALKKKIVIFMRFVYARLCHYTATTTLTNQKSGLTSAFVQWNEGSGS